MGVVEGVDYERMFFSSLYIKSWHWQMIDAMYFSKSEW